MAETTREEEILNEIRENFPGDIVESRIQRERRIWVEVKKEKAVELMTYMKEKMGFGHLSTISGRDFGDSLGAFYHLSNPSIVASVLARTETLNPALDTVVNIFPVSENFERELECMFGIRINGLFPGRRYPLPEDWPDGQYPLRKSWNQEEFSKTEEGACYWSKYLRDKPKGGEEEKI